MLPVPLLRRVAVARAPQVLCSARMSTSALRPAAADDSYEAGTEAGSSETEEPYPLRTGVKASRYHKGVLLASATSVLLTRADKVHGPLRDLAVRMVEQQERKRDPEGRAPKEISLSDDQVDRMVTVIVDAAAKHIQSNDQNDLLAQRVAAAAPEGTEQTGESRPARRPRRKPNSLFESQFATILSMPLGQLIMDVKRDTRQPLDSLAYGERE